MPTSQWLAAPGELVDDDALKTTKARELVLALRRGNLSFVSLVECRRVSPAPLVEAVVFEVEVERSRELAHDIRKIERICIQFSQEDSLSPEVTALRTDFPLVPHVNIGRQEFPRSLCLYGEPYSETRLKWTPLRFIERTREWLSLTAKGALHADDQPLEPLLPLAIDRLIVPGHFFESTTDEPSPIYITSIGDERSTSYLASLEPPQRGFALEAIGILLRNPPQMHGNISIIPSTLSELHDFLARGGSDLIGDLRSRLRMWYEKGLIAANREKKLWLVITYALQRSPGGPVEATGTWGFVVASPISAVGESLGLWSISKGEVAIHLSGIDPTKRGENLRVEMFDPISNFTPRRAAQLNGFDLEHSHKAVMVGQGALGSQLFANLMRSAFAQWTLVDDDILLPHNLARHALPGSAVGWNKALAVAAFANSTISENETAKAIAANVLTPGSQTGALQEAFGASDLLIDASASVAVARHLSRDVKSTARRLSTFISPSGLDSVLLCESANRNAPLDWVEMQYYRAVVQDPKMAMHLENRAHTIRYARSCRDVSSRISQDAIAIHAGILSRGVRSATLDKDGVIRIWRINSDDLSVEAHQYPVTDAIEFVIGDWTIVTDRVLISGLSAARAKQLPNETGGILLGSVDSTRKLVYVVDTVLSPSDSIEWPASYIRGYEGLNASLEQVRAKTLGNLDYVGEWHSHPDGCSCKPSTDDLKALAIIAEGMAAEAVPAVMVIIGQESNIEVLVGQATA